MTHLSTCFLLIYHFLVVCQSQIFDADVVSKWQGQSINCTNDTSCTIICDEIKSCFNATVNCPTNNYCSISCLTTNSCNHITINPPQNQSLFNITFTGSYALFGVEYPIYKINDYNSFSLTCDIANQCTGMIITCPRFANCNIFCVAAAACNQMSIQWPIIDGYGSLICDGNNACRSLNFPIPEPSIPYSLLCNEDHICYGSYIICPANATCNVTCNAIESCRYTTIICPKIGECNVEFSYTTAGDWTNIYCQSNENCNVKCLNATNACHDTHIYWSNTIPNKNITCNPITACNDVVQQIYVPSNLPSKQPTLSWEFPTTQPSSSPLS
eukprot:11830_1